MKINNLTKQKGFKHKKPINDMTTILFGRLVFDRKIKEFSKKEDKIKDEKELLLKVINFRKDINKLLRDSKANYYIKNINWCFAGIKKNEYYIYGKLVKETICEKLKRDEDYIIDKDTESKISFFLIDLQKNIIVYESKKKVGEKAPIIII